jgi:hypothetical protein
VATKLFRYGFGRDPGQGDQCALGALAAAPDSGSETLDYRALVLRVVASDAFRLRTN